MYDLLHPLDVISLQRGKGWILGQTDAKDKIPLFQFHEQNQTELVAKFDYNTSSRIMSTAITEAS